MWILRHIKREHVEHYIFFGEECVVGRKDATILLTNDASVSRRHAVLYIQHPEENVVDPSKKTTLFLKDEGSKYGTFHNGRKLENEVQLNNGDIVKFGQLESEYKVHDMPFVVTTSCLGPSEKRELKANLRLLGGHLVGEWQPTCTHLVMSEIKITVKALCSLVSAKPIVKPEYFLQLMKSLKDSSVLLATEQFIPPIGEALIDKDLVSFSANEKRRVLFKDKTFFFLDEKQYKKLHLGIVLGGGSVEILQDPSILVKKNCCLIEPATTNTQELRSMLQHVTDILQKNGLRAIPESDVGMAVAYCSIEKYCNPKFSTGMSDVRSQRVQSQTLTEREILAPETPEHHIKAGRKSRETISHAMNSLHLSSLRAGTLDKIETSQIPLSATIKRELDDLFNDDSPPPSPQDVPRVSSLSIPNVPEVPPLSLPKVPEVPPLNLPKVPKVPLQIPAPKVDSIQDKESKPSLVNKSKIENKRKSPSPERKTKMVRRLNSPPQRKSAVKEEDNAFPTTNGIGEEHHETELPRNLVKVQIVPLLRQRAAPSPTTSSQTNPGVKNFKKFKKVQPKGGGRILPRIIGAHELIPFDRVAANLCDQSVADTVQLQFAVQEASQPVRGEFDWDTPSVY